MGDRALVSIRRKVPSGRRAAYDRLWQAVQEAAGESGAHAWRFISADDPVRYVEFLEFASDADPSGRPAVRDALAALDGAFPGDPERWAGIDT